MGGRPNGGSGEAQMLAETVAAELREASMQAQGAAASGAIVTRLQEVLNRIPNGGSGGMHIVEFAHDLQPPLKELIGLLRAELADTKREHILTEQDLTQAPPAYRPAVADYFEQLSRNYQAKRSAPGAEK